MYFFRIVFQYWIPTVYVAQYTNVFDIVILIPSHIFLTIDACFCSDTVRLVDGPTPNAGHIELFYEGQWQAFCDDEIFYDATGLQGSKTATVVCRSLGYT